MEIIETNINDVLLIKPTIHSDNRGLFFESFNHNDFCKSIKRNLEFVQDNHSISTKNVLRGMHFQQDPMRQGKLVRVVVGEVYDVVLDIRESSDTYGKWIAEKLSAKNKNQLWIPEGLAHGFLTLSDEAHLLYKVTNYYSKTHEKLIRYDDPKFNISWPSSDIIISDKDKGEVDN
jgi:dTDP-4-dehydrorhamnose 3,5-epimerase